MICETCGKQFTEDWRKDTTHSRKTLPRFCSTSCSNRNSQFHKNEEAFQMWIVGGDISHLGCTGVTNKGELRHSIKHRIKEYLLDEQKHCCKICGVQDIWNDKPFTMILDHINGDPYNHCKNNLRLICPICDSQLPTHGSKNRGNGRHSARLRYERQRQELG